MRTGMEGWKTRESVYFERELWQFKMTLSKG